MKYIVYLTTNVVNNKIYIGVHGTENPDKFDGYIGNSINIYESNSELKYPKIPFHKAVKKYGYSSFKRVVIKVFDTEEEALDLEAEIVNEEFIKRDDTYNITIGGGYPPNLSKVVYQYNLNGDFIKEWESATQASAHFGKSLNTISHAALYKRTSFGYLWSYSKLDKLDISEYNIYQSKIPIYLYDNEGNFIKQYDSMSDCCKDLKVNLSRVQRAVKLGNNIDDYYLSTTLSSKYIKPTFNKITGDFHQYDLNGNYIRSYQNGNQLKEHGFCLSDVHKAIKIDRPYKEFIWIRGEKLDSVPPKISKLNKAKKIGQYTIEGKLVKTFNTLRSARKEFPNVSKVLNGTAKHCHNFLFKYIE